MTHFASLTALIAIIFVSSHSLAAEPTASQPTTMPVAAAMTILKNNCLSCHNPEKKKGNLILSSHDLAMIGDDDGPVILPGNAIRSRLIAALSRDADPHMPPKKQLAPDEVATLREWIDAGAPWDAIALTARPATRPVTLHEMPSGYHPVLAIALSADQKQLAVGRRDRIYLHELTQPSRPVTRVLDGPADAIRSMAWSADGTFLAAGGYCRIVVWPIKSQDSPIELHGLEGRVTALCFLPDSGTLLAADGQPGEPGRIQLYHLPEPEPKATISAHADTIFSLVCSPDGKLLASAGADKLIKLWSLPELKEVAKMEGHTNHVLALAFNFDGSLIASAGADRDVKLWDVKTHDQKTTIGPHLSRVNAIAWTAPKTLAAAGDDGSLRMDAEATNTPGRALPAANDSLYCVLAASDGKTIYAGCHDGQVYVWINGKQDTTLKDGTLAP